MRPYAQGLLLYVQALVAARRGVEAFVFGTRLTRVTPELAGRDRSVPLARLGGVVADWAGGRGSASRCERSTASTAAAIGRGATVIVLSDGWDRGETEQFASELARLRRTAHRSCWLNPLKARQGYEPLSRGMAAALPHLDAFLAGNSLAGPRGARRAAAGRHSSGRRSAAAARDHQRHAPSARRSEAARSLHRALPRRRRDPPCRRPRGASRARAAAGPRPPGPCHSRQRGRGAGARGPAGAARARARRRHRRDRPNPGPAKGRAERLARRFAGADAVVFGHTHQPEHDRHGSVQIFNPGSPTDRRRAPVHTMGLARVADGVIDFELVALD